MNTRKVLTVVVCLFTTLQLFAQNNIARNKHSWDLQLSSYNEIFYSSNLSILNNNPQKTLLSSNAGGVNLRYNVLDIDTLTNKGFGAFAGLNYAGSSTFVSNDETATLLSAGLIWGVSFQWSKTFSSDIYAEVDWARYKNEFTYLNTDYTYKKNGMRTALALAVYASPIDVVKFGVGLKYNIYTFNNNKPIEATGLSLKEDAAISSLTPYITLSVKF